MARHPLPPHVYNAYAWGGYLLWKLSPRYQDFIDGRANTLFSSTLLNDYFNIYAAAPNWRRLLNQYRVQTVLVEPGAPIVQALSEDPRWRTVYKGGNATILVRRDWRRFS
jgi:hypothetical protein